MAYQGIPRGALAAVSLFDSPEVPRALAQAALDALRKLGAGYGDIRIGRYRIQSLSARDERIESIEDQESLGFGVRVLDRGAWGFAASNLLTAAEIERVTAEAVAIARASALALKERVVLALEPVHKDVRYVSPCATDPFAVPVEEKIALLLETNALLKKNPGVKVATSSLYFQRREQLFASLEGSLIETIIVRGMAEENASAVDASDKPEPRLRDHAAQRGLRAHPGRRSARQRRAGGRRGGREAQGRRTHRRRL